MKKAFHCKNMNHSRILVSIQFCPMCGEKFNTPTDIRHCTEAVHALKKKNRDQFCADCGENLEHTKARG